MPDVFVNYRSVDARFGAAATYELLSGRFGKHRVFLDNQSIPAGTSYLTELGKALDSMRVLLVLIGPAWLVDDPELSGSLLIERDNDWVRREIRRALERRVPIVPVLLDGSSLPDPVVLPPDIRQLVEYQAVEVHHHHLGADVGHLADRLAALIPATVRHSGARRTPVARQLPAQLSRFVGREQEIARLDRSLGAVTAGGAPVTVVCGPPGVGKTTLATHWAHRVADRFPDGQLYVNLRGFDRRAAVDPGAALHGFLTALGLPPEAIPDTLDARAALYRSSLTRRGVLVVLDNADTTEQVHPLLPGTPSCPVLVTSRTRLHGLAVRHGARHVTLAALTESEAHQLLADRLEAGRLTAEPTAATALIEWCAGLPLALCVVGALADQRTGPLSQLVRELGKERNRLDALELGDEDLDLRTVFSRSYQRLSAAARRLFRLLGTHPGPDIGRDSCIALCQDGNPRQSLDELVRSNLVTESVPGRLGLHDLIRVYAAEQAHRDATAADRSSVPRRIVDHYLRIVTAAAQWLDPSSTGTTMPGPDEPVFDDYHAAMTWCLAESATVPAVVELAARHGFDSHVWRMAPMCNAFLRRTGRRQERVGIHRAAVAAAARAGDEQAWAASSRDLANALARLGRHDEANAHLAAALLVFENADDRIGQLQTHMSHTRVLEAQERYEEALRHARIAVELARSDDRAVLHADALINLGIPLVMLGRYAEARPACTEAFQRYASLGHLEGQANSLLTIGMIHQGCQEHVTAIWCYERSSELDRELGDRYWEAICMEHLGEVRMTIGQPDAALRCWRAAFTILDALHHNDAERLRRKLTTATIDNAQTDPGVPYFRHS